MFRLSTLAVLAAAAALAGVPRFNIATPITGLKMGYQLVVADLNRDGRKDLIVVDERSTELAWYENPSWSRHVLVDNVPRVINLECADLDGDNIPEIAMAHHFETDPQKSAGVVLLLKSGADPRRRWTAREIDRVPTAHRLRWIRTGAQHPLLLVAPLVGPGSRAPDYGGQATVYAYRPGEWKRRSIADGLSGVLHSIAPVDWSGSSRQHLLTASFDGIDRFVPSNTGVWKRHPIARGDPRPCPQCGSSEVKMGRLGSTRFLAAIEPWHGNQVVVYTEHKGTWSRAVLDDTLVNGHALAVGDLDADGRDEIVAGFRGAGFRVAVFHAAADGTWIRQVIDSGNVAAADCKIDDLTGDGLPDIACSGASTGNVLLFENRGRAADGSGHTARRRSIEANLVEIAVAENRPPVRVGLEKLMQLYRVPAISLAVIDNFEIAWTATYGVLEPGSQQPVTPDTLFQAGSISKPVAAAGALALVEQGVLALDEDVNRKLKRWKVPGNEFTQTEKVTLRRLLSHTAGLTVHGFPGYPAGAKLPSLPQILDGQSPANTAAVRVDLIPGTEERYSGGGVTVEQLLMEDVTGKPFPALLRELVLDRIGMTGSSYEQPLPPPRAALTAGGAHSDGSPVPGRWRLYPEMAAAGLWSTPSELAKFAIELALSRNGKSNRILSAKMTELMLTPVRKRHGLGFAMDPDRPAQFGHNGADDGFQALLTMDSETGQGLVLMANSDNGLNAGEFVLRAVAREYGWKGSVPPLGAPGILTLVAKLQGAQAALKRFDELKAKRPPTLHIDEQTLNIAGYRLLFSGQKADALLIFKRNVAEHPGRADLYNSLGEAYSRMGKKAQALRSYRKALERDPGNRRAADMIKRLNEER